MLGLPGLPGATGDFFHAGLIVARVLLGGLHLVYTSTILQAKCERIKNKKHSVGVECFLFASDDYARFADFRFAVFFEAFFADRFFDDFLAALFFAAIKIFLLCKQRVIDKKFFMITTMTITLYI
jgi:hypothetical protein